MEKQGFFSKSGDHFRGTLIAGALIILPIAIVVGLLIWVFLKVEGFRAAGSETLGRAGDG